MYTFPPFPEVLLEDSKLTDSLIPRSEWESVRRNDKTQPVNTIKNLIKFLIRELNRLLQEIIIVY